VPGRADPGNDPGAFVPYAPEQPAHAEFIALIDLMAPPSPVLEGVAAIFPRVAHLFTGAPDDAICLYDFQREVVSAAPAGSKEWLDALLELHDEASSFHVLLFHDSSEGRGQAGDFDS